MKVTVLGGNGTAGSAIVKALSARGVETVAASRSTGVDVLTGEGLDAALAGADVVIDALNADPGKKANRLLISGTANALAAASRASVKHYILLSIVGIESVRYSYYETKLHQEQNLLEHDLPATIIRSTQFHEFVDWGLAMTGRWHVLPLAKAKLQPVAVAEVAEVVADFALAAPPQSDDIARAEIAGPQVASFAELAAIRDKELGGGRRLRLPFWLTKGIHRELAAGALTSGTADRGTLSYQAWLADIDTSRKDEG